MQAAVLFYLNFVSMTHVKSWHDFLALISLRYFMVAGLAFLFWYVIFKKRIAFKKIQPKFPESKDYRREIAYSICTVFIFSLVPTLMLLTPVRQYTQYYTHISDHSLLYFWLVFPVMFIVHDTYFYFTHRLMHHPKLFKTFHLLHHRSTNPSPWTAFAFNPLEAIVEAGIFALLLMIMPLCGWHLFGFFLVQMLYNVYGHLGWELYPKGFNRSRFGKWINTSVNHNQHHKFFKGNYSLYFLWWDRLFGTLREDYDATFDEVKNRQKNNS
jgi:lathosterol oxidase